MRKAVKGFADSMLDLTVQNSIAKLVQYISFVIIIEYR